MIKTEQIPDEVVEALHAIFADDFGTLIPKGSCRAAIAAALAAWPGAALFTHDDDPDDPPHIILPLSQEGAADLNEGDDELLWRRD